MVVALAGCSGSSASIDAQPSPDARPEPAPPAGIIAWFKLNNSLVDSSGHQMSMQVGGPYVSFFDEGYFDGGCHMDGASQYAIVDAPSHVDSELDFPGGFTVAMWVRPERTPTDFGVLVSRSSGTGSESSFALAIDSTLRLRYDSQGGASLVGTTPLALDRWAFVALTYDGASKRVFLDGVLDGSAPAAVPVTWDDRYVFLGAVEGASMFMPEHHVQAWLDDVMLFERALDESELAALAAR